MPLAKDCNDLFFIWTLSLPLVSGKYTTLAHPTDPDFARSIRYRCHLWQACCPLLVLFCLPPQHVDIRKRSNDQTPQEDIGHD